MEILQNNSNKNNTTKKERFIKIITNIGKIIDKILTLGLIPDNINAKKSRELNNIPSHITQDKNIYKILCTNCGDALTGGYCSVCGK